MLNKLFNLPILSNKHYIKKYIDFISNRQKRSKFSGCEQHHALPKAKDFFPEFKSFKENGWNKIYLSSREHYIAHAMLHRAFPGSSMSLAFYYMSNILRKKNSYAYLEAKLCHIEKSKEANQNPIRNAKISAALKNKPKTEAHKNKLKGPRPEWHGKNISAGMKLSQSMSWKDDTDRLNKHLERLKKRKKPVWTDEQKLKMSITKRGTKASDKVKLKMSEERKNKKWFTNGFICTFAHICPEGENWGPGRIINKAPK